MMSGGMSSTGGMYSNFVAKAFDFLNTDYDMVSSTKEPMSYNCFYTEPMCDNL